METTVKERLIRYLQYKKIPQRKFEIQCNLSNGYVSNISKSIGTEKMQIITQQFPDLNAGWLLTGEGSMLRDFSQKNEINSENSSIVGSNISGNGNTVNASTNVGKLIDELGEQRKAYCTQIEELIKHQNKLIDAILTNK